MKARRLDLDGSFYDMPFSIRSAHPDECPSLRVIERDAAQRFRTVGLDAVADSDTTSEAFLRSVFAHGIVLCAAEADDAPIGFLLAGQLDHALHLYEISVSSAYGGQGIGSALLAAAEDEARRRGLSRLTLATFRDVPWNRPFYERRGFAEVLVDDWTPAFFLLQAGEELSGLPLDNRLFMRKELG